MPIHLLIHMMPLTYIIYISIATEMCRKILIFEIEGFFIIYACGLKDVP